MIHSCLPALSINRITSAGTSATPRHSTVVYNLCKKVRRHYSTLYIFKTLPMIALLHFAYLIFLLHLRLNTATPGYNLGKSLVTTLYM
jgi:hypothetical protein